MPNETKMLSFDFNKYENHVLNDGELCEIGEAKSNGFIRWLVKDIFGKIDQKTSDHYFRDRGIEVIKQHNLCFLTETLLTKPEPPFLTQVLCTSKQAAKEWNNFFQLRKLIEEQKKGSTEEDFVDVGAKHWMEEFVDFYPPRRVEDRKFDLLMKLNELYQVHQDRLPAQSFAALAKKIIREEPIPQEQLDLLTKAIEMSVAVAPQQKRVLVEAFLLLGDKLPAVIKHENLLKKLATLIPPTTSAEDLAAHLGEIPDLLKAGIFDEAFILEYFSQPSSDDLAARNKRLQNMKEWAAFFVQQDPSVEKARAFIAELGVSYMDAGPTDENPRAADIKKLYSFYRDAIKEEKLQPRMLAKALKVFLAPDFHKGVESLGASLPSISFFRKDAQIKLLEQYVRDAARAKETKTVTTPQPRQEKAFATILKQDPASVAAAVLPEFVGKISEEPATAGQLREALAKVSPFVNELVATKEFQSKVDEDETTINYVFNFIKIALSASSRETKMRLLGLAKTTLQTSFSPKNKGGLNKAVADAIVAANALYIARQKLPEEARKDFEENLTPIQKWLLDGLPALAEKTPFINTLVSIGTSVLGTRVGQWAASKIAPVVVNSLIDQSPLTPERKDMWKKNQELQQGIDHLIQALLPAIPKIKEKHDLAFYSEAVRAINEMVHSSQPVDPEEVYEKISEIVHHFVDQDFAKYEEPIMAALAQVPALG